MVSLPLNALYILYNVVFVELGGQIFGCLTLVITGSENVSGAYTYTDQELQTGEMTFCCCVVR